MEEILIRDEFLHNVINSGLPHGPAMALQPEKLNSIKIEFAYLQLRMICELIALGCLVAHGDIAETHAARLQKSYEADGIIKALEKLHPDFYPKPSQQPSKRDAGGIWRPEPITSGFLTKQELLSLYGECGRFLHKGSLQRLLRTGSDISDLERPIQWVDKIWRLLSHHQIQTIDQNVQMIGLMKDKIESRPQFSFWKRRPDGNWDFDGAVRGSSDPL